MTTSIPEKLEESLSGKITNSKGEGAIAVNLAVARNDSKHGVNSSSIDANFFDLPFATDF